MLICIISTNGNSLNNFRGRLIRELIQANHQVVCISIEPESEIGLRIQNLGASYYQVEGSRTGLNIFKELKMVSSYKKAYQVIKPDMCFLYMSKPIAYGGWAAIQCKVPSINILINGLENAFYGNTIKDVIVRQAMCYFYKKVAKKSTNVFFQNFDDYEFFLKKKLTTKSKSTVLKGSGVDMDYFRREPLPEHPAILMIARLLRSKGIQEYFNAIKIVKAKHPEVTAMLVGGVDNNDEALTREDLEHFISCVDIEYYGHQEDVRPMLKKCSLFVLPSYHEGTPRSVLEAMATGRPIITTDAPGCRETVIDGYNGFLVPIGDSIKLAEKISIILEESALAEKMAVNSFNYCLEYYDVNKVNQEIIQKLFCSCEDTDATV